MTARRPPGRANDEPPAITPPHSREMEQAAIGAMLMLDNAATTRGMTLLHPKHFYSATNSILFDAIRRIAWRRETDPDFGAVLFAIDIVFVHEELKVMDRAEDHHAAYLAACIECCPSSANIDAYIGVVIDKAKLRYRLWLRDRVTDEITQPFADVAYINAATHDALNAISIHGWCDLDAIFTKGK